ncbi:MAG: radical SAM protein, partial [Planctomycetota bacterium]
LGFSCGLDFETRIVAKPDAPRLLRSELASPAWAGEPIALSGVTDPYQPLESKLQITRGCLEVMAECRQPVSVVTKSRLITRDIDLLSTLARHGAVSVAVSVTTLDPKLAAVMEPRASRPADRLRAVRELSEAGIPVMVYTAPIIPGLNDREIPSLLQAAAEAGAGSAHWMMIRLPHQVKTLFLDWLRTHLPDRAARIEGLIRQLHGGRLYDSRFGIRSRGRGPVAEQIATTFKVFAKRCGLEKPLRRPSSSSFRRPADAAQLMLFEQPPRLSRRSA